MASNGGLPNGLQDEEPHHIVFRSFDRRASYEVRQRDVSCPRVFEFLSRHQRNARFINVDDLEFGDTLVMVTSLQYLGPSLRRYLFCRTFWQGGRKYALFLSLMTNEGNGAKSSALQWFRSQVSMVMGRKSSKGMSVCVSPTKAMVLELDDHGCIYGQRLRYQKPSDEGLKRLEYWLNHWLQRHSDALQLLCHYAAHVPNQEVPFELRMKCLRY